MAPESIEGWGGPCQETGWLSFEYVDSLIIASHGEVDGRGSVWWKTFPTAQAIHKVQYMCKGNQLFHFN